MKFLYLLLSFILFSCSTEKHAGGTWDETGNTLSMQIIDQVGKPAIGAKVSLLSTADWTQKIASGKNPVDTILLTDSLGKLTIHLRASTYRIEVNYQGQSVVHIHELNDTIPLQLRTAESGSLHGQLTSPSETWPDSLWLWESSLCAPVLKDGSFFIDGIPAGYWTLVGKGDLYGFFEIEKGQTLTLDSLIPESQDSVLLEDFEDGNDANRYYPLTQKGWWFCGTDGASQVIPGNIHESIIQDPIKPELGAVAHLQFLISDTITSAFALCGMDIDRTRFHDSLAIYNLQSLDSITLWIRGNASLEFQLISLLGHGEDSVVRSTYEIPVDSIWRKVRILPTDFLTGSHDWDQIAPNVNSFVFLQNTSMEFWIDNITLHGIGPADLFPQLRIIP